MTFCSPSVGGVAGVALFKAAPAMVIQGAAPAPQHWLRKGHRKLGLKHEVFYGPWLQMSSPVRKIHLSFEQCCGSGSTQIKIVLISVEAKGVRL